MCGNPFFFGLIFGIVVIVPALTALFYFTGVRFAESVRHSSPERKWIWAATSALLSVTLVLMWLAFTWKIDEIYYQANETEMNADTQQKFLDFWRKFRAIGQTCMPQRPILTGLYLN